MADPVVLEIRPLGPLPATGHRTLLSTPDDLHFTVDVDGHEAVRLVDALPDGPLAELAGAHTGPGTDPEGVPFAPAAPDTHQPVVITGDPEMVTVLLGTAAAADWVRGSAVMRDAVHEAFAAQRRLVVCQRGAGDDLFAEVDKLCADARVTWLPVRLQRNRTWLGPWVQPGRTATWTDLADRLLSNAVDPEVHRALNRAALGGDCGQGPDRIGGWAARIHQIAASAELLDGDLAVEVGPGLGAVAHPVLPIPTPSTSTISHDLADLVDPVTGIVRRTRTISHHPSVPPALRTVQADVCTIRRVSRWSNNTSCQGAVFSVVDDPEQARLASIGEAVERYCGNILDTLPVEYGSWESLRRRVRGRVLDPHDLVLYSDQQYATPGFPFVPLTRDLEVHWVPGRSLSADEAVWVPASMVYVNWFTAGRSAAPVTNFCPFAGIAAGPDLDFAVASAVEEVIERHATMVWWLNGQPLDAYQPDPDWHTWWHGADPQWEQEWSVIGLDNEFEIPVAAGVLANQTDQLLNIGFSARPTMAAAAAKAWTEALTLAEGSRDLLPSDGRHWQAIERGELNGRSFKPWRSDRRYLDDFRADMRDCDDLMVQQQVHLDPRAHQRVRELWDRPRTRSLADAPELADRSVDSYRSRIEQQGHEVIVVDITSGDVAATGMRVVRAIVPGTVGNAPAAFPFLGQGKVQQLAVDLGWRERPLTEDAVNHFPLPHA